MYNPIFKAVELNLFNKNAIQLLLLLDKYKGSKIN